MLGHHFPEAKRIFELPIYRCVEEQHQEDEKQKFDTWIEPLEAAFFAGGRTREREKIWDAHREKCYDESITLWDFNEIVGWIRLYAWPGNIRAYLFITHERITKGIRRKIFFTKRGNFIEVRVFPEGSNEAILSKLRRQIASGMTAHRHLCRLHLDTGMLDVLGPYIDWARLTEGLKE